MPAPAASGETEPADDWRRRLIRRMGEPKPLLANAITALREAPEWRGVLFFNEFTSSVVTKSVPIFGGASGNWTDHEDRLTANWLQHAGIGVSSEVAGQAVQAVARDQLTNPVREYFAGLPRDGTPRIGGWLNQYLGVAVSDYSIAVGERYLAFCRRADHAAGL